LVKRGSITFWFNEEVMESWYAQPLGKPGRAYIYSDVAIECCALLRLWFNKLLRATQGLMQSLLGLIKVDLEVPSYTQISRRQRTLLVKLKHGVKGSIHVVVDASGLKVFGEGEWKVRQHGYTKRRMWRKLHIGIDVKTQEVVMMELTDNRIGENKLFRPLLEQYADGYSTIGGDKGYDSFDCHEAVGSYEATSAILLQRKSKIRERKTDTGPPLIRDEVFRRVRKVGRNCWKKEVGYHQRSLVETAFFRFKALFGDKLHARCLENQKIETLLCCNIMNQFTQIGMPNSVPIP
jgi:hypothetical protein